MGLGDLGTWMSAIVFHVKHPYTSRRASAPPALLESNALPNIVTCHKETIDDSR
jgi:hypothetical protein